MTIGIKSSIVREIVEEKVKSASELQKEFNQMTEYLQYLKSTVSSMQNNNSSEEEILKKKREINILKNTMLELEHEIKKAKTK
jgi:predicted nuclease with TOPRIM domain